MDVIALIPVKGKLKRIKLIGLSYRFLNTPSMEVRIKNNNEMIDATIEMIDGVMVVSPKDVKPKFKYGEEIWTPLYVYGLGYFKRIKVPYSYDGCNALLNKGWCFKTEAECQAFCDRLNEATNSVKP